MIEGRFGNTTGRPYVNGRLMLPRLKLTSNFSFLVDTGADVSAVMPTDGIKMGINYQELLKAKNIGGIGGNAKCFQEDAILAFTEPNRGLIRFYSMTMMIFEPAPHMMKTPSIIGRDILDRWRINYDPSRDSLKFTVRSADHTA